ncbi:MmgE/PrpD family protein [Hyphomonas adhaerens MHS-3]|uniref:MmgE/PrpD family protein n=1 Tax=Hyphomonas adhaerens MHS-3 TaxID=1280949 RepID=A0A069E7F5_9PROT|nr:MmgE/PrpD family protein [Hyphomonas adhaerens]KCZ86048.1 MmgE/PrpD family protein [Hyphomonas adhaerens MHS-3]
MIQQELTEAIATIAASYQHRDFPDDVELLGRLVVLDNIGCTIRGTRSSLVQLMAEELFECSIDALPLLSGQLNGSLNNRAMLHAAAAHAIDFDDTLVPAMSAHAGSAVVSASLQLACELRASGPDLITAVVAGYETAARVGALLHPDHYLLGFHPTATVGVFGAAAAAGQLLKLDSTKARAALGLAATQACGLKCTFGTMAKPYNAAHAASSGLLAARLVARGFTAPLNALEIEKGYLSMFFGLTEGERKVENPGIFRIRDNAFKFHAACHATHPMIEALHAVVAEHAFDVHRIARVDVSTTPLSLRTASVGEPKSGLEGKFSFPHVAALVLAGRDTASDESYSQAAVEDKTLSFLRPLVHANETGTDTFKTSVSISMLDGGHYESSFDFRDLMSNVETVSRRVGTKFLSNAWHAVGHEKAERLRSGIMNLSDASDVRDLLAVK